MEFSGRVGDVIMKSDSPNEKFYSEEELCYVKR